MDLLELKKIHFWLARIAFFVSIIALAFVTSINIINALQVNLYSLIGFSSNVSNYIVFVLFIGLLLFAFYELIISLIFNYFSARRLFFPQQKQEVKFTLRIAFLVRNIISAGALLLGFYYHPVLNFLILFDLVANLVAAVIFYFICKNEFGGYAVAAHIFRETAKVFFFIEIASLIVEIGGLFLI